jgi:hypothetical protein
MLLQASLRMRRHSTLGRSGSSHRVTAPIACLTVSDLLRPAGVEPTTSGSGGQQFYEGVQAIYNTFTTLLGYALPLVDALPAHLREKS